MAKAKRQPSKESTVPAAVRPVYDAIVAMTDAFCRMTYYHDLAANLKFPFKARSEADGMSLTVHRLPDPEEYDLDEDEGRLCEARDREGPVPVPLSEVDDAVGNRNLVRDYGDWFWNGR